MTFQPPNFDRIHSFLEERLGTRDVQQRLVHARGNDLVVYSNRSPRFSEYLNSIIPYSDNSKEVLWINAQVYDLISDNLWLNAWAYDLISLGPNFVDDKSRNSKNSILRNSWILAENRILNARGEYALSISTSFIRAFGKNPPELYEHFDSHPSFPMAHEAIHGAIIKSGIDFTRISDGKAEEEGLAMHCTLEYLAAEDPVMEIVYRAHLKSIANARGLSIHARAADLVNNHQDRESMRKLVYDANKRLVK